MSATGLRSGQAYDPADERAIRTLRMVGDWTASGLLTPEQRDRIAPELQVDLRRTNKFLRATLFVFGFLIVNAVTGLVAVFLDVDEDWVGMLCGVAGAVAFVAAMRLVARYKLYRFGIEEALAVVSVIFFAIAAAMLFEPYFTGPMEDVLLSIALAAAAVAAFAAFYHFGFVYAAVAAVLCAAFVPFELTDVDWARRLVSIAILAGAFLFARSRRQEHGGEFPGDSFAMVEAVAWGAIYVITNLQISPWLSHAAESGPFYWATYAAVWMLPAAGLWIAIREKHRALLDVNIVMALATLMTNKPYLGAERYPWDPIVFGVLLIGVAVAVRRWLASGAEGERHGFVPARLLASEKERLAVAGTVSVLQPTGHAAHPPEAGPSVGGGGRSGGAGATGSF